MRRTVRGVWRGAGLTLAAALLTGTLPAGAASGASQSAAPPAGGMVLDRVVAVVNDEAVTLSEIQEEGQPVVRRIFQDFVGEERERRLEDAQKRLLDDLIDRRLMSQVAKREGMLPSAAEIAGAIEELKRNNNATDDASSGLCSGPRASPWSRSAGPSRSAWPSVASWPGRSARRSS